MSKTLEFVEIKVNEMKKDMQEKMDKEQEGEETIDKTIKINELINLLAEQFREKIINANFGSKAMFDKIVEMEKLESEINKIKMDYSKLSIKAKNLQKNITTSSRYIKNIVNFEDIEENHLTKTHENLMQKIKEHSKLRKEIKKLLKNRKKRMKKNKKKLKKIKN